MTFNYRHLDQPINFIIAYVDTYPSFWLWLTMVTESLHVRTWKVKNCWTMKSLTRFLSFFFFLFFSCFYTNGKLSFVILVVWTKEMWFGEYETGFERNLYSPEDRDPFYDLIRFTPRNENLSVHTLVRKLDHDKLYECDFTSYPFNEECFLLELEWKISGDWWLLIFQNLQVHSRETRYRVGTLADRVSYEMRRTRILPRIFIGQPSRCHTW